MHKCGCTREMLQGRLIESTKERQESHEKLVLTNLEKIEKDELEQNKQAVATCVDFSASFLRRVRSTCSVKTMDLSVTSSKSRTLTKTITFKFVKVSYRGKLILLLDLLLSDWLDFCGSLNFVCREH